MSENLIAFNKYSINKKYILLDLFNYQKTLLCYNFKFVLINYKTIPYYFT